MTPFNRPITALYWPLGRYHSDAAPPEPVAIIAVSDAEYLAIDIDGRTVFGAYDRFEVVGSVKDVVLLANEYLGS